MPRLLRQYFGAPTPPGVVPSLPDKGSTNWAAGFNTFIGDLVEQIKFAGVDKTSVFLPAAGVVVAAGAGTQTNVATCINAANIQQRQVFLPVLTILTGADTSRRAVVGVDIDVYFDTVSNLLRIDNISGGSLTILGFVYFPQYENYLSGLGSI